MAWNLGQDVSRIIYTGTTGETFTRVSSYINGTETSWSPTFTEIGSGYYRWSYTPAVVGSYEWAGTSSNGSTVPINFDVDAASATISMPITASSSTGVTRKYLRREIGRELGQCIVLTATDGGTTELICKSRLTGATNSYRGRTIYFTGGTAGNLGLTRDIVASNKTNGQVEWSEPLPDDVADGDEAELWGVSKTGVEPWEVEEMINAVISDGGLNYGIPVLAAVTDPFDMESGEVEIPATITKGIISVQYQKDGYDDWITIDRASYAGGYGYWVNRGLGTMTIGGSWLISELDGLDLQIIGEAYPDTLDEDTDTTDMPKQWIIAESCLRLNMLMLERSPEIARPRMQIYQQRAIMAKPYISRRREGSMVRV